MREIIMLVAALTVAGAMLGTLTWFFRRLRSIEEETLGMAVEPPLGEQVRAFGAQILKHLRKP